MDAIEGWLYRQRRRIQCLHQVQFGVDVVEPMFSNELRAYYNRRRRWTTQVHFGHLHHHNHMHPQGNPHMQDNQNSPPTQQDTEVNQQSMHVQESHFPSHIENDHPSAPQNTPTQAEQVHASLNSAIHSLNLSNNTNPQTEEVLHHSAPNLTSTQQEPITVNPIENVESSFVMRPPWQPLVSSDLRWTWVEGEGPFITNGEVREATHNSSETESESLTERYFNLDKLNEERPEVRTGKACRHGQIPESPEEVVESLVQRVNRGRCRFERGNSSVNLNRREELKNTTNVVGETYGDFATPQNRGLGRTRSLDLGLELGMNSSPLSIAPDPSSPMTTRSDLGPQMEVQKEENWKVVPIKTSATTESRKQFRVEIGRLGRNIRQRLLCGLCHKEGISELNKASSDYSLSILNYLSVDSEFGNRNGQWEVGPMQLPRSHENTKLELQGSGQTYCSSEMQKKRS